MSTNEDKRIKLLDIITKDENKIEVKEVAEIFIGLFTQYFELTKTGKKVKDKLSKDEYVSYVTGFVNSYLSSLYASAAKNKKELKKRMDLIKQINEDVLVSMEELDKHGKSLRS